MFKQAKLKLEVTNMKQSLKESETANFLVFKTKFQMRQHFRLYIQGIHDAWAT